ncbi:MAG: hypothetical protein IAG13_10710 [Deltaproteobacteria bacterium]|nr:hypothetical protein [Nannocystaceae bacterium]
METVTISAACCGNRNGGMHHLGGMPAAVAPVVKPKFPLKLVLAIVGGLAVMGVVGMLVTGALAFGRFKEAQVDTARLEAVRLRELSNEYVLVKRRCPGSVEELRAVGMVASASDPWGGAYGIACDGERRVTVTSPGADGVAGTEDDVRSGG